MEQFCGDVVVLASLSEWELDTFTTLYSFMWDALPLDQLQHLNS